MKEIEKKAKRYFKNARGSHGWDHVERVYNLCLHIGKKEKANLEVLKISALLHDIARQKEDESHGKVCHALEGAKMARKILKSLKVNQNVIDQVAHCIETHRFRNSLVPETIEAKVLFDADKLDSIGAVGLGRAFLFAGEIGSELHDKNIDLKKAKAYSKKDTVYREYLIKLKNIKAKMMTKEGKRLANDRDKFMKFFFDRLNKEIEGEV